MTVTQAALAKGMIFDEHLSVGTPRLTFDSFVEYETAADLAAAVEKLDNHDFKGSQVRCISDVSLSVEALAVGRVVMGICTDK